VANSGKGGGEWSGGGLGPAHAYACALKVNQSANDGATTVETLGHVNQQQARIQPGCSWSEVHIDDASSNRHATIAGGRGGLLAAYGGAAAGLPMPPAS